MRFYTFIRFFLLFFRLPALKDDRLHRIGRIKSVVIRIRIAVFLLVLSVSVGTTGYMLIEDVDWFDAYYMSVITLASVGYSEVFPLSDPGRAFTSGLILFNIGSFAYAISSITGIFAEGGFTKTLQEFRMIERIRHLNRHTIVCGFGRHAHEVAEELSKQGIDFVIIEKSHEKLKSLVDNNSYLFIEGDATADEVLLEAGIDRAKSIVVTLPSDADNLFIVLSSRQMNPSIRIISRANNEADEIKIRRAGADHVVIPERIGGFYMATLINKPDLVQFFTLLSNMGPGNVVFEEIPVGSLLPKYRGKTILESRLSEDCRIPIVALRNAAGQYELNPPPTEVLAPDRYIVIFGNPEQMRKFREKALAT